MHLVLKLSQKLIVLCTEAEWRLSMFTALTPARPFNSFNISHLAILLSTLTNIIPPKFCKTF